MSTAYYLRLGPPYDQKIIGTSRDRYHIGWIKLVSFGPQNSTPAVSPGDAGPGLMAKPVLALAKYQDQTSMELAIAANTGRLFNVADIDIADARTGMPKLRMAFNEVLLDTFSTGLGSGLHAKPTESFTLSFNEMRYNHDPVPEETAADMLQLAFKSLGLDPVR